MISLRKLMILLVLVAVSARAEMYSFDTPSDDRWHYPFNFTPGLRAAGSVFGAVGSANYNDRDGMILVAWETGGQIEPNLPPEKYLIRSVKIIATNQASEFVIPGWGIDTSMDEWFTYDINGDDLLNNDGFARSATNDTDGESNDADPNGRPIELYGVGFGPTYTPATWTETSLFIGSSGSGDIPRDPWPLVFKEFTGESLHAENSVEGLYNDALGISSFSPAPWATGIPQNYAPGITNEPFDVVFDVDLERSEGNVRHYFQEQLSAGKVFVALTSLAAAAQQGSQSDFPSFFMKEGLGLHPQAKAIRLDIDVTFDIPPQQCGDFGTIFQSADVSGPGGVPDCYVNLFDLAELGNQWLGCTDPANPNCL